MHIKNNIKSGKKMNLLEKTFMTKWTKKITKRLFQCGLLLSFSSFWKCRKALVWPTRRAIRKCVSKPPDSTHIKFHSLLPTDRQQTTLTKLKARLLTLGWYSRRHYRFHLLICSRDFDAILFVSFVDDSLQYHFFNFAAIFNSKNDFKSK